MKTASSQRFAESTSSYRVRHAASRLSLMRPADFLATAVTLCNICLLLFIEMVMLCIDAGVISESLGGLTKLTMLDLTSNQLSGIESILFICLLVCCWLLVLGPLLCLSFECFDLIVSMSKLLCVDVTRNYTAILGRAHQLGRALSVFE